MAQVNNSTTITITITTITIITITIITGMSQALLAAAIAPDRACRQGYQLSHSADAMMQT
jgi:hypothetical protein